MAAGHEFYISINGESTAIEGLGFVNIPVIQTRGQGRMILGPQWPVSIVTHPQNESDPPYWGLHVGQDDVLFIGGLGENRTVRVQVVDCRKGSPTLHRSYEMDYDDAYALRIPRGVAHRLLGMAGLTTVNMAVLYAGGQRYRRSGLYDTLHIPSDQAKERFPIVDVGAFPLPGLLRRIVHTLQLKRLGRSIGVRHSFEVYAEGESR